MKKNLKEDFFNNVKPGHIVHYLTPQGQTLKGKVVMNRGTHLVLNRGNGQPQVVTPKNFVKAQDGTRVTSALLSNVAKSMKSEETIKSFKKGNFAEPKSKGLAWHKDEVAKAPLLTQKPDPKGEADWKEREKQSRIRQTARQMKRLRKEEAEQIDEISKETKDAYVAKRGSQLSSFLYAKKQNMTGRQQKNAVYGLKRATGKPVGIHAIAKFAKEEAEQINELSPATKASYKEKALNTLTKRVDAVTNPNNPKSRRKLAIAAGDKFFKNRNARSIAKDNERERIASGLHRATNDMNFNRENVDLDARKKSLSWRVMQKKKKLKKAKVFEAAKDLKTVNWNSIETKNFSVYKHSEGGMPLKHHIAILAAHGIPARKAHSPYVGHTALEIPARHEKKAAKILYREGVELSEVSAPGQEDWIKANKARFIAQYGKEKGLRVLYAKAWKMAKEEVIPEAFRTGDEVRFKSDWAHGDSDKVYKIHHTNSDGMHWVGDSKQRGWYARDHQLRPARTWKKTYKMEEQAIEEGERAAAGRAAERSWVADLASKGPSMSQSSDKRTGHYLMRGGRKLSGPHSPDEAVKQYKGMSDSKGVKIVHVKEAAAESKVKKAANKAVALAKNKAKVDTKPALDIPAHGTQGPMEASHSDTGAEDAKI